MLSKNQFVLIQQMDNTFQNIGGTTALYLSRAELMDSRGERFAQQHSKLPEGVFSYRLPQECKEKETGLRTRQANAQQAADTPKTAGRLPLDFY